MSTVFDCRDRLDLDLKTDRYVLNMGPQHPATHGVFRMILTLDGEVVVDVEPVVGYLHRGVEKLAEARTYTQVIPYTDRLDYLAAMLNNLGYVQAVEKMLGVEVPERAEYIRVICCELNRIASHLVSVGTFSIEMGGFTGFMYTFRERERIMDLLEMISGSRMTVSFMRVGGVADDLPPEFFPAVKSLLKDLPAAFDEYDGLITGNEIFQARTKFVGILDPQTAINYSVSGPVLRASGVNWDLRKKRPYSVYDRFDFEVPLGERGDSFDRFRIRIEEMRQSARIIQQALDGLPEGPVMAKVPKVIKPPAQEVYHEIEGARGIVGYYLVSDGSSKPYRMHVRRPSFINLGVVAELCRGWKIADVVAILGSIDVVMGEVDC